jgi:CHAT domain-containing protein
VDIQGEPKAADPSGEHWACVVRHRGPPVWIKLPGTGPDGVWTKDDDELVLQAHKAFSARPGDLNTEWQTLARKLYVQRLAPLQEQLQAQDGLPAVKHLIVLPSPQLAGIPVEILADQYLVSYAPSGTMFAWLQERKAQASTPGSRSDLLAVGDPIFTRPQAAGQAPEQEILLAALALSSSAARSVITPGDIVLRYAGLMQTPPGEVFAPLPATRREIEAIAQFFPNAERLLGSEASEQNLDQLARAGRLRDYRFLHFATHGVLDERSAMRSALILAQDQLPDPLEQVVAGKEAYAGRLTAEQILRNWQLDAELVTLSACQTGLGKLSGGEGYLGFSQALFVAGARSLVLSLWKVDDTATALLMTRFYENLLGARQGLEQPVPKAQALAEAKSWLRGLSAEAVQQLEARLPGADRGTVRQRKPAEAATPAQPYAHPYYWSGFILIGDPQ